MGLGIWSVTLRDLLDGKVLYRFGMIYGGNSFLAIDLQPHHFLAILRNVTSWPASEDFDLAARYFGDS